MLVLYSSVADYMACCQLALLSVVGCVAHAAGWCSCGCVVDGACCKLAHSTINGIEVLQACAFMVALLMQLACAIVMALSVAGAHVAGWCS